MKKKPVKSARVVGFKGDFHPEVVTQEALRELEGAQRVEWSANRRAILLAQTVKSAIQHGASVELGALYFDVELEMVRSRKKESAG